MLQKRLLLLPLIWLAFGAGVVFALRNLLGGIVEIAPTSPNDKPIGGSILPVLFFDTTVLLGVISMSLYSVGVWKLDLSSHRTKADLVALFTLVTSGFLLWYFPVALFSGLASLVYFLAVNIE